MPRQNRVTPMGELIATPARGLVYGNRGCLHDDEGRIRRRYAVKRWIACRLRFKGWHREPLMQPGRFTELFFLDEDTAMAAGHRPCALCRHEDYVRFVGSWRRLHGEPAGADAIDARLHAERLDLDTRTRRLHRAAFSDLPDGAFVRVGGTAWLVRGTGCFGGRRAATTSPPGGRWEGRQRSSHRRSSQAWRWGGCAVPLFHPTVTRRGS